MPHGLRHTAGINAVDAGLPITGVAQYLGHASTRMLVDRYAFHRRDAKQRAVALTVEAHLLGIKSDATGTRGQ